jgi:hypothetical protein
LRRCSARAGARKRVAHAPVAVQAADGVARDVQADAANQRLHVCGVLAARRAKQARLVSNRRRHDGSSHATCVQACQSGAQRVSCANEGGSEGRGASGESARQLTAARPQRSLLCARGPVAAGTACAAAVAWSGSGPERSAASVASRRCRWQKQSRRRWRSRSGATRR